MDKPILIGCEESQMITSRYRSAGIEAYSCDLLPTRGNPLWHIQQDVKEVIKSRYWRLIILHPDCTKLAISGNKWYGRKSSRYNERLEAIEWTLDLWELSKQHSNKVALENPQSGIFKYLNNVQYIQPWQFGHYEKKKTGFALHNLPPLEPTNIVYGWESRVLKMGPSETRKRDRSTTYPGIADAIVQQWR